MRTAFMRKSAIALALLLGIPSLLPSGTSFHPAAAIAAGTTGSAEGGTLQKSPLWSDDFDSYETGGKPTGLTIQEAANTQLTVTQSVYSGAGGKSIQMADNSNAGGITLTKSFDAQSNIIAEFDIQASNWLEIHLRSGTASGPRFYLKQGGILEYYRTSTGFSRIGATYETTAWNRFRLEVDNAAHTFDVYMNDVQIAQDVPMDQPIDQVDNLYITTNRSAQNYSTYLDNMELYTYAAQEPEQPGPNFVALWAEDFEADAVGSVPDRFQYGAPSGSAVTVTDHTTGVPGTHALKVADDFNNAVVSVTRSFTPSQDVIFEMDVYADNWLEIHLREGTASGARFYFKNNGIMEYYRVSDGKFTRVPGAYATNQWNRLRIETDTASGSYHVYLNGAQIGVNLPMDQSIASIDQLYLVTNRALMNTVYVDNMSISGIPLVQEPAPLELVAPADEDGNVRLPARFEWSPYETANGYTLMIAEDEAFAHIVREVDAGQATEMYVPDLEHVKTYYWKVTADTPEGIVESLQTYRFTTEPKRSLLLTDDFESYELASLPFNLVGSVPAGSMVQVSDSQSRGDGSRSLQIADGNDSIATKLTWPVNSVRDAILELDVYVDNWLELHLREGTSSGPRITFKHSGILEYYRTSDGKFTRLPYTYATNQWMRVRIETRVATGSYKLYINGTQIGGDIPMDQEIQSIDNWYVSTNTKLTHYTAYLDNIRLEAYRKDGAPDDFALLLPADQSAEVAASVTLTWAPSPRAEQYRVQVSRQPDFGTPVVDTVIDADATSLPVDNLLANAKYYWKVSALNGIAVTDSSEVFSFDSWTTAMPLEISLLSGERTGPSYFIVEAAAQNHTDQPFEAVIAAALYTAGDELQEIVFVEKLLAARGEERFQAVFSLPDDTQDCYIKLMIWDNLESSTVQSNVVLLENLTGLD